MFNKVKKIVSAVSIGALGAGVASVLACGFMVMNANPYTRMLVFGAMVVYSAMAYRALSKEER